MGKIFHFEWFLGYEPKKYVINSEYKLLITKMKKLFCLSN